FTTAAKVEPERGVAECFQHFSLKLSVAFVFRPYKTVAHNKGRQGCSRVAVGNVEHPRQLEPVGFEGNFFLHVLYSPWWQARHRSCGTGLQAPARTSGLLRWGTLRPLRTFLHFMHKSVFAQKKKPDISKTSYPAYWPCL